MRKKLTLNLAVLGALSGLISFGVLLIAKTMVGGVETDKYLELAEEKDNIYRNIEISKEILNGLRDEMALSEGIMNERINKKRKFENDLLKLVEKKASLNTDVSRLIENKEELIKQTAKIQEFEKPDTADNIANIGVQDTENIEKIKALEQTNEKLSAKISQLIEVIEDESFLQSENYDRLVQQNASLQDTLQILEEKNSDLIKNSSLQEKQIQNLNLQASEKEQTHGKIIEDLRKRNATELSKLNISLEKRSSAEIKELRNLKTRFEQLNGLKVIFSGYLIYDEKSQQIVFRGDNAIGIPIFQDDFTGSIAGKCGLPIDEETAKRCSATIIAEFVVSEKGLFLRGKEIVEIIRK